MKPKTLRILCFGDSLTSGYCSYGLSSHPYSLKLEDRLTGALPNIEFEIITNGIPGDVASFDRFLNRMKTQFENETFDWTIVLGGTNDLGYGISSESIYEGLQKVWDVPLSKGSNVLALTVPECHVKADRLTKRRDELNLSIMTHQQPNFYFYDLESKIPYHALTEADREKYWDDGLHLTEDGYDWMGQHIAEGLIRILNREEGSGPSTSPGKAPTSRVRGDNHAFMEEAGNPRNLSEGYVIVRKRDLD